MKPEVVRPSWPFIVATRAVVLAWVLLPNQGYGWFTLVVSGLVLASAPYGAWTGTLKLSPAGLGRRTIWVGWEQIPWERIADIAVDEKRLWGHRIVVFDEFDPELKRGNRVVLSTGGSLMGFGKPKQRRDLAQLHRWWLAHRDVVGETPSTGMMPG